MENKFFPSKKTPYEIESSNGPHHAPKLMLDPAEDDWWPDLVKPLTSCVRIAGNKQDHDASVGGAEGTVGENGIDGMTLNCDAEKTNGIVASACSDYKISGLKMKMSGVGEDDFAGIGAGVMSTDKGSLVLEDSEIEMSGAGRTCTFSTQSAEITVKNCHLYSHGGEKPADYQVVIGPGMLEPPPALGIGGTARTHLSIDNSKAYFADSFVEADAWACLSTDAALGDVYLTADNTTAVCHGIGYCTYSDGGCHVVINNCDFKSGTHLAIVANSGEMTLNNVEGESGRIGVMFHGIMGDVSEVGHLHVNGGIFTTQKEFMLSRSMNTYVELHSASIVSKSGVLAHAIINQDPDATQTEGQAVYGNNLVLADMRVEGDVINDDADRTFNVDLERSTLKGALKDVHLHFDSSSRWVATGDSSVVLLGDVRPGQIDTISCVNVTAYAGEGCGLLGTYSLRSGGTLTVLPIE